MKTKEPNAQRKGAEKDKESKPNKRFSRRDALKAGLALVGAAVLKKGCSNEYKSSKNDGGLDGSTSDASGLDANVTPDASMLDGSISHDASVLPDAHVPDATVQQPDATASTCVATQVEEAPYLLNSSANSFTVGEYTVTWTGTAGNTESTTADVACTADNAPIAAGLTLQKGALVDIPLDAAMKMTLQFSAGGQGWVVLIAGISQI